MAEKSAFEDVEMSYEPAPGDFSRQPCLDKSKEFRFQQSLACHSASVRAVCASPMGDVMMSGSIDYTNKLYNLNQGTGLYDFTKEVKYHEGFVLDICSMVNGLGFFSAGRDNKAMAIDIEGNPMIEFHGHEAGVNSVSQALEHEVVTGSWDGTAKIWDVNTGQCKATLEGHTHAVSVLTLQNGITITGSQDKKIRLWHHGQLQKEWVAHEDIVRGFCEVPQLSSFASISNDQILKVWTLDGLPMMEYKGHDGFIFALDTLESGELVTAGEDCTVKIWDEGACKQTIQMPRTIWSLSHNKLSDIIVGCENKKVYTLTRDDTRVQTESADYTEFLEEIKGNATKVNGGDVSELGPLKDFKSQVEGKIQGNEGEVKVFRDAGVAKAYMWSGAENKWTEIGEVVDPTNGAQQQAQGDTMALGNTKQYPGDALFPAGEYDHVFDVELGDNIMRKLPFNNGANYLEAADKFIARENLSRVNIEQIVQFLKTNSRPERTRDFDGTDALKAAQKSDSLPKCIEKVSHMFFMTGNMDGAKKKILEFNQELNLITEMVYFDGLVDTLGKPQNYHSSDIGVKQLEALRLALQFPIDKVFPCIDLYRMFLAHPQANSEFSKSDMGAKEMANIYGWLAAQNAPKQVYMLALRATTNLFKNQASQNVMFRKRQQIMDAVSPFAQSQDKNTRMAAVTIFLNYSIDLLEKKDEVEGKVQGISALTESLRVETDLQVALRTATALAYFVHLNEEGRELLEAMDLKRPNIGGLQTAPNEQDIELTKKMVTEVCDYLRI